MLSTRRKSLRMQSIKLPNSSTVFKIINTKASLANLKSIPRPKLVERAKTPFSVLAA